MAALAERRVVPLTVAARRESTCIRDEDQGRQQKIRALAVALFEPTLVLARKAETSEGKGRVVLEY